MKKLPLLPTILVGLAIAGMIALGVWQLNRAKWKEGLLAEYAANTTLPPVAFPSVPVPDEKLLYRRASGYCLQPRNWSARAGQNRDGMNGWRHVAVCQTGGAEGPGMAVDFGWSDNSSNPTGYKGGPVTGVLDWDRDHVFILVADRAAPGLQPSMRPSPADIPNNHEGYAVQWFLFAGVAAIIYGIALRRRNKLTGTSPGQPE
jgi:cytochrome oxidase assembly protein ShyY1